MFHKGGTTKEGDARPLAFVKAVVFIFLFIVLLTGKVRGNEKKYLGSNACFSMNSNDLRRIRMNSNKLQGIRMNFKEFEWIYFNLVEFDMKSWFKVEKIKDFLDLQSYFYIRINSGQIQSKISLFWLFLSIFVYLAPISNLVTLYGFVVKFYVKLTSFSSPYIKLDCTGKSLVLK